MATKRCGHCGETKSLEDFGRNRAKSDCRCGSCKKCCNERGKANYAKSAGSQNPQTLAIRQQRQETAGLVPQGLRRCTSCKEVKSLEHFHCDAKKRSGCVERCRTCVRQYQQGLRAKAQTDEEYWRKCQSALLNKKYGVTLEWFESQVALRGMRCDCCGKVRTRKNRFGRIKSLVIDHDHATGEIRGLICPGCNVAIGNLGDSASGVEQALKYLGKPLRVFDPFVFVA